jgi:outer membrane protein
MSALTWTNLLLFGGFTLGNAATGNLLTPMVPMKAEAPMQLRAGSEDALHFTIREAEAYALSNHPQIKAANLTADAVRQEIREARSAFFPQIYGESDSVLADDGHSRFAAEPGLNDSQIFSRQSDGIVLSQLITDFGRTYELTESARFRANAAGDRTNVARAVVILTVDRAYFDVLRSHAILNVADETVKARDLAFRQISALAQSGLKSTLDVNFAQVDLSQAQVLQLQAVNDLGQSEAQLSTALGFADAQHFALVDVPIDQNMASTPEGLIQEAIQQRPELANLRDELEASQRFAKAQDAQKYPKITALAAAGINPIAQRDQFQSSYYMAGINIEVPITTGGNLQAQAEEAHLFARAATDNLIDAQNTIGRDVRIAWLDARTSFQQIGVAQQMVQAAAQAQKLAQSRYSLGTSSIVEFTQAQLNYTQAELQATASRYDYQVGRSLLNFTTGSTF